MTFSYPLEFKACIVLVHPNRVETLFREDGSTSTFYPPHLDPNPWPKAAVEAFMEGVRYAGYPDTEAGALAHAIEHDIAHAFVADWLGWPHSYAVWSGAHPPKDGFKGEWSERVKHEEALVVALQRYMNTGLMDEHGLLESAFGGRLDYVADKLMDICWGRVGSH